MLLLIRRRKKLLLKTLFFVLSFYYIIRKTTNHDKIDIEELNRHRNECIALKKELRSEQIDSVFYFKDYSNQQKLLITETNRLFENDEFNKLYLDYKVKSRVETNKHKYVNLNSNLREKHVNKQFYLIIEYTKFFGKSKFCNKKVDYRSHKDLLRNDLFRSLNITVNKKELNDDNRYDLLDSCLFKNCFFTCDRSYITYADIVLFHESDLSYRLEKNCHNYDRPKSTLDDYVSLLAPVSFRKRDQIWLLWNDEANRVSNSLDSFMFNWTLSYRSESEASYGAYGVYTSSHDNKGIDQSTHKQNIYNSFKQRKHQAVWFSSNCESKLRLQFVIELSKIIPLYVYGSCARFVKNRANAKEKDDFGCSRNSKCETDLLNESKFYLAFESKNCTDYITEKYWRTLSFGLIPVVIQPAKMYYERLSQTRSYIHVEDFNYDHKKLVNYLNKVSNDFDLYYSYFKWVKNTNDFSSNVIFDMRLEKLRMCELCMKLNKETSEIYYKSVSNYFNDNCIVN